METNKEKKLYFIVSKKGGVGKSAFAYKLGLYFAQKDYFPRVVFFDADTERNNPSSMRQLSGIFPADQLAPLTFSDRNGIFAREKIENFIELFGKSEKRDVAVVDLGSKTSDNLAAYLSDPECTEAMKVILEFYCIKVTFFCLFAGNMIDDTVPDIEDFFSKADILSGNKIIVNNKFFSRDSEQEKIAIALLEKQYNAGAINFQFISETASKETIGQLSTLINNGVNIQTKGLIPLLKPDTNATEQERLRIDTANEVIKNFWNPSLAIKLKVRNNFEIFSHQLNKFIL